MLKLHGSPFKPLDIVKSCDGSVGIVKEISWHINVNDEKVYKCSVAWFGETKMYSAWLDQKEIEVIDNLARVLANEIAHPFSSNKFQGDEFY